MALGTVNSNIAAKEADPYFGNRNDPVRSSAGVVVVDALYEIGTGLAATDIIRITRLPERAKVLPHLCWIECENPGTTLTLDIGDDDDSVNTGGDADRYADGIVASAGGGFAFTGADGVATLTPYVTGKDCWLQCTVATAASLTAGQKIRFHIVYAVNN